MASMNERDKQNFLQEMLRKGESYQAAVWGTVSADPKAYALFSTMQANRTFSEGYCYIGMSEESFNIVVVNTQNPGKIVGRIRIPFSRITAAKISGSIIPGRKTVELYPDGYLIRLKLMKNTAGTDLQGQKDGIIKIIERIRTAYQ